MGGWGPEAFGSAEVTFARASSGLEVDSWIKLDQLC